MEEPDPLTLEGIGAERIRREDTIIDVCAHIKPGPNFVELAQFQDDATYVCALYVTKLVNIYDMTRYVRLSKQESFMESLERLKTIVASNGMFVKEMLNVRCPITLSRLKLPARGDRCTHLQCFEVESYFWINTICKKWICPICLKRTYRLSIDGVMLQILKKVNQLYPSDLGLENMKTRKEVIETLLSEVNQTRAFDEQESIVLDKNDIDSVTLHENLTIEVGVRTFIIQQENPEAREYLNDFNPKETRSLYLAAANEESIKALRKEIKAKNKEPRQLDTIKIPYKGDETV